MLLYIASALFAPDTASSSGSSAIRPSCVRIASTFRLVADSIIDGVPDPLLAAEISLGCLH